MLVGVGVLTATLFLWYKLNAQEGARIEQKIELEAASVKIELTTQMQERILALVRNAKRWENAGKPLQKHWEADAELYVQHYGGYQGIAWVDPSFYVQWIVPRRGNEATQNLNLASQERWRLALETARKQRKLTVIRPINWVEDGKGFLICVPIFEGERFEGFIVGMFHTSKLFDTILHENITQGYGITIFDGNTKIYHRNNHSTLPTQDWTHEFSINWNVLPWRVKIQPTPELFAAEQSPLPEAVLGTGTLLAVLLAMAVHLAQSGQRRTKQVEAINQGLAQEISDRILAEKALFISQQHYQALVNWIDGIVWEADVQTFQLTFVSQKAEKLSGYPVERWLSEPNFWENHLHPEDREWAINFCTTSFQRQREYEFEYRMIAADGRIVWLRNLVNVVVENNQPVKLRGVMVDITRQKQVEAALRESEARFRAAAEGSLDAFFIFQSLRDEAGRIIDFTFADLNSKGEKMISMSKEQVRGKRMCELLPINRTGGFFEKYVRVVETEIALEEEFSISTPEVKASWLHHQVVPLSDGIAITSRDISERKHSEEALKESEERYRALVEQSAEGICLFDGVTKQVLEANPTYLNLIGYTQKEILELSIYDIVAIHRETLDTRISKILSEKHLYLNESQHRRKDGSLVDVSVCVSLISYRGRKVLCTVVHDITERKQAQEALQESEARLRLALEAVHMGTWDWNIATNEVVYSDQLGPVFGLAKGTYHPNYEAFLNSVHPEDREAVAQTVARAVEEGADYEMEYRVIWPDGSLHWVATKGQVYFDQKNKAIRMVGVAMDITERKEATEALRQSEERWQLAVRGNNDGIWDWNLKTNEVFFSTRWKEMLGYGEHEISNHLDEWKKRVHPDDMGCVTQVIQDHFAKKTPFYISEHRVLCKNGTYKWVLDRGQALWDDLGNPVRMAGSHTDITDRKQTEQALQEANEKLTGWVKELEQRTTEITLLNEMSDILQACRTVQEAYSAIATLVQPLFPNVCGGVFAISASRTLVEAVATWGNQLTSQKLFTPDECWALRRGRSHWVEDTQTGLVCKHLNQKGNGEESAFPTYSVPAESLCVPMMAQGEALGLLYLSALESGHLSEAKQRLAVTVAEHIALALANLTLQETLQRQSIRDSLTGLFNRRYLEESLVREIHRADRKQQPLGIIMLDVDHFKRFNDTFGHEAGDAVLREMGLFVQKNIRESDIACRYGGEELMLILPETCLETTRKRAEQIREGVKHLNVQHRRQPLGGITISVGVACFPEDGLTGEALIQAADTALYEAKAQGRDRVVTVSRAMF